jgi:gliding motility-associated-like protein
MKKVFLLFIAIFTIISFSQASHIVGGDIAVKWIGPSANDFQIQVTLFRSCGTGAAAMPTDVSVALYDLNTHANVSNFTGFTRVLNPNLPFGDACFTPTGLCVDEGIFTKNVTIANRASGYFLSYDICCRNAGITNLANSSSAGMTFYCEIPDPGNVNAANNSNPTWGIYPLDAYLCVNSPKMFQFNVTDVDGDSLVYSLVEPLDDGALIAAPAFPWAPVVWAAGYNLGNIVGGASPMVINQNTGMITAAPGLIGTYVFGVRVEEFRNGVKIGETRRDAQYEGLACTSGNPPSFLNVVPTNGGAINFPYNYETCKDLIFNDLNTTDTLYLEVFSDIFDSNAYIATMIPNGAGDYTYFYNGNNGINPPTIWNDSVVIPPNQTNVNGDFNIGTIATRFCWTPKCNDIGKSYPFQVNAYSLGCDGRSQDSIIFDVNVVPPVVDFKTPTSDIISYGFEFCKEITFRDPTIVDLLNIDLTSDVFGFGAYYPSLPTTYTYNDTIVTGVANNAPNTVNLGTKFCWTPDCEHIGNTYSVRAVLSSVDCPTGIQDTVYFDYTVAPPFDSLDVIPNVFTPNGDGMNDTYTLGYFNKNGVRVGGTSNPCNDELSIEIYNRWGQLVYDTIEPTFEWDGTNKAGKDLPSGTYFVIVKGTYGSETIEIENRTITLMR